MRPFSASSLNTSFRHALRAGALAACLVSAGLLPAVAQDASGTRVLKGQDVTESNLISALTPDEPEVVTRSLKVGRDARPAGPARKPSASLLITFETNSSTITPRAKEQLDVVASALLNERLAEYSFNVEGHADPRGNSDSNLTLSQQRAESVRQYLVSAHSIEPQRLKALGKGDRELLNTQVPAAPENRRVTIVTNLPETPN
jgi:OOP family OmpA-OmpF porin